MHETARPTGWTDTLLCAGTVFLACELFLYPYSLFPACAAAMVAMAAALSLVFTTRRCSQWGALRTALAYEITVVATVTAGRLAFGFATDVVDTTPLWLPVEVGTRGALALPLWDEVLVRGLIRAILPAAVFGCLRRRIRPAGETSSARTPGAIDVRSEEPVGARRRAIRAVAVTVFFALLTVIVTWPGVCHLTTRLIGSSEDGYMCLWNLWWVDHALTALHANPFHTELLFCPTGTHLYWHDLGFLLGLATIPLTRLSGLIGAFNLIVMSGFLLGGLGAYLLARECKCTLWPSLAAGVLFAFSALHVGLVQAGNQSKAMVGLMPFFCLCTIRLLWRERGRARWALLTALLFALNSLANWYFAVMAAAFSLVALAVRTDGRWTGRGLTHALTWASEHLGQRFLTALLVVLAAWLAVWQCPGTVIACIAAYLACRLAANALSRPGPRGVAWCAASAAVALLLLLPVLWPMYQTRAQAWERPSRTYAADALSLIVPPPDTALGSHTRALYDRLPGDPWEKGGYVGLVAAVLLLAALSASARRRCRLWWIAGATFWMLSWGSTLRVAGVTIGPSWMPYALLDRYVPFFGAADVTARFALMTSLAVAVLAGCGLDRLLHRVSRPLTRAAIVIVALLGALLETWPSSRMLIDPPTPAFLEVVRTAESGVVLDLTSNGRAMWHQTIHGRPIFGGLVPRCDLAAARYVDTHATGTLLRGERPTLPPARLRGALVAEGARFVIADDGRAPRVTQWLEIDPVARDRGMVLYILGSD